MASTQNTVPRILGKRRKPEKRHGRTGTPEWVSWSRMINRCRNPRSDRFKFYGERGIYVSARWLAFSNFLSDMGNKPSRKHSIERIDNDGPYAWWNCKWATKIEQARNTRKSRLITHNGKTQTMAAWADELGLSKPTLCRRCAAGLTPDNGLFERARKMTKSIFEKDQIVEWQGEKRSYLEWSKALGIKLLTLRFRVVSGRTPSTGLFAPVVPGGDEVKKYREV